MIKKAIFLFLILASMESCLDSRYSYVIIDANIAEVVGKNIVDTINTDPPCGYIFVNKSMPKYILNDSLFVPYSDSRGFEEYSVKWKWEKDSVYIRGSSQMTDGARGFNVTLADGKTEVFGFVSTHIFLANLGISKTGPKGSGLTLPTKSHILTLDRNPSLSDSIISGYIEFETSEFYEFQDSDTSNFDIQSIIHYKEKIYFKANRCDEK